MLRNRYRQKHNFKKAIIAFTLTMSLANVIPTTSISLNRLSCLGVQQAQASTFKFGIAPSIFYNLKIAQGQSLNLSLFLANNSELDDDKPQTIKDFTMDVKIDVKCDMKDEEKNQYTDTIMKSIKVKPPVKHIAPNQKDTVDVFLTIPQKAEIGEYRYSLVFTKMTKEEDKKKNADTGNSEILTAIEVPLYVEVFDPAHPNKGIVKQGNIVDTFITSGEDVNNHKSSVSKDVGNIIKDTFKYAFTNFTPKRIKENWHDFKYKPYRITGKKSTYFDITKIKWIPLTKALAFKNSDLSIERYILATGESAKQLSAKVGAVLFEEGKIIITLENGKTVTLSCNYAGINSNLKKQLEDLQKTLNGKSLTLGELYDKLTVPMSPKWNKGLMLHNKVHNLGNVTVKPVCNVRVSDENNHELDIQRVNSHFMTPKEIDDLSIEYTDLEKWNSSKIKFETAVAMGSDPSNANKVNVMMSELIAKLAPIRMFIGAGVILLWALTIGACVYGIKAILKRRKEETEETKEEE